MKPFLYNIAQYIIDKHPLLNNIVVVLPGKRAGIFLKKYLSEINKKTFLLPHITTMGELCEEISGEYVTDKIILLTQLYESYYQSKSGEPESFESFLIWGQILLNDYNELDRQLIDVEKFYANLRNLQDMEDWSFNLDALSARQIDFENFWHAAGKTYTLFNERCTQNKMNYSGRLYKKLARNTTAYFQKSEYEKIYFCGFNALSKAEEKIMTDLCYTGKAQILWDMDEYYIENNKHAAGYFYRKFKKQHPNLTTQFITKNLISEKKNIQLYSCNGNVEQIAALKNIIGSSSSGNINEAIVLCDESLIIPFFSDLPDRDKLNITMGYSIRYHPLFSFYKSCAEIIDASETIVANQLDKIRYNSFYIKHFRNNVLLEQAINVNEIQKSFLVSWFKPFDIILTPAIKPLDFLDAIKTISESVKNTISERDYIAFEIACLFEQQAEKFKNLDVLYKDYISPVAFKNLFFQLMQNETLSFIGEPLQGTQVMGMLETRALDFEAIYIISFNEEIIPKINNDNSFIPNELKLQYGLPTRKEQDSIYAYNFYRLLQRAKNIHLFYNNAPGVMGSSEPSRYAWELEHVLIKQNPEISFAKKNVKFKQQATDNKKHEIVKDEYYYRLLDEKLKKGISPTAINTFIRCPLDFFYKTLLGVRDFLLPQEMSGHDFIGNVVHYILENFYKTRLNRRLHEKDILELKNNIDLLIHQAIENEPKTLEVYASKIHLFKNICKQYITNFCNNEIAEVSKHDITVKALEEGISVEYHYIDKKIILTGKIDRIDTENGILRVLDYKTGKVTKNDLSVIIDNHLISVKYDKAMQLLIYVYMVFKKFPQHDKLKCGIYALKQNHQMINYLSIGDDDFIHRSQINDIETLLKQIFDDMYSSKDMITHFDTSRYCILCN